MTASLLLRSPDQPLASSRSARVRINTQYLGPYTINLSVRAIHPTGDDTSGD